MPRLTIRFEGDVGEQLGALKRRVQDRSRLFRNVGEKSIEHLFGALTHPRWVSLKKKNPRDWLGDRVLPSGAGQN